MLQEAKQPADYRTLKGAHLVYQAFSGVLISLSNNPVHYRVLIKGAEVPLNLSDALRQFSKLSDRGIATITAELVEELFAELFEGMILTVDGNKVDISEHLISLLGAKASDIEAKKYYLKFSE